MKKVILLFAVAAVLSACGGGGGDNGTGTVAGIPADPVPAGQGDAFVSAVLAVTNADNADMLSCEQASATYDNSIAATLPEFTVPDTLA